MPVKKIRGYVVLELPDGGVRIGPYTFDATGQLINIHGRSPSRGPDEELVGHISEFGRKEAEARNLYREYLESNVQKREEVKNTADSITKKRGLVY